MKKLFFVWIVVGIFFLEASEELKPKSLSVPGVDQSRLVDVDLEQKILALPERTTDLVIINDNYENISNWIDNPRTFSWGDFYHLCVMSAQLLLALSDNQVVLVSKSSWLNVVFLMQLWKDASYFKYDEFYEKYHIFFKFNENFQKDFLKNQTLLRKLEGYSVNLNDAVREMAYLKTSDTKILAEACRRVQDKIVKSVDFDEYKKFEKIFSIYTLYAAFIALPYQCVSVADSYLLFVPGSLIKSFSGDLSKFALVADSFMLDKQQATKKDLEQSHLAIDIALGLKFSALPRYMYDRPLAWQDLIQEMQHLRTEGKLDSALLVNALRSCVIDQQSIKKELQDYTFKILPNFNLFLIGHGSIDAVAEMSYSTFYALLDFFKNSMRTKTLLLLSCYASGVSIKDIYQYDNFYNNAYLESLPYTIILPGVMKSYVTLYHTFLNFSKLCELGKIYADQVWAVENNNFYSKIFRLLNYVESDSLVNNYIEIMKIFSLISEESEELGVISNFIRIKYPHVPWFSLTDYGKTVKTIGRISAAVSDRDIVLGPEVKVVLLEANKVDSPIVMKIADSFTVSLVPVNYHNSYYRISKLVVEHIDPKFRYASASYLDKVSIVTQVLNMLLGQMVRSGHQDPVVILIDQADFFGIKVFDILFDCQLKLLMFSIHQDGLNLVSLYNFKEIKLNPIIMTSEISNMLHESHKKVINLSNKGISFEAHYRKLSRAAHRYAREDRLDIATKLPPTKESIAALDQVLQNTPPVRAKQSKKLQESWSAQQQHTELYGTKKINPKSMNPYAKPFIPKVSLVEQAPEASLVTEENPYVKTVDDQGKVRWVEAKK